ncbi:hypothetical protein [Rhizobium leguminosarum]|uniref:hypothetical protein n=1 Tax=Rhizobium leguminosarum TaxID=384 RepID=UPI00103B9312|nr:hypothetical protein [Rhizobium leguminosarum]TBZ69899.1 hypothetical protein E0H61_32395 [Rhizobium leguminosarum bv. viciae]
MAKKPTGNQGRYRVIVEDDGNASGEFLRDLLGTSKDAIELRVVELFAEAWKTKTGVAFRWHQNPENDVDFTLGLPGGRVKLELTELVLHDGEGNPFKSGNKLRTFGQYAEALVERVTSKSNHYQVVSIPTHLLIYPTHEPFDAPGQAIALAKMKLKALNPAPVFENIFYLQMLPTGPIVRCLHPTPDGFLSDFNPDEWENRGIVIFDPTLAEFKSG